jgi:predicted metal-dependent HD superfamily phosphohydrolase
VKDLSTSWSRAWQGLGAQGDGHAVRDAVLAAYAEAHRRYHSLQHLQECLDLFESVLEAADHPAEVEMALWFHDAIYALKGSDNEARSADWAREVLIQAGVAAAAADLVRDLILVTRHSGVPRSRDEQVLVDVDLAILGAAPERFAEYQAQIREEYAHVPGFLFRMKRRSILASFVAREAIYSTPVLHQRLEARARANLAKAIAG